jgi:hypothetical protein
MSNRGQRWPLPPISLWEKSLSSWMHHLAAAYRIPLEKWFEAVFHEKVPDDYTLDTNPSYALLAELSLGTGFSIKRLYRMTAKAYIPWITDGFDQGGLNLFSEYFDQSFNLLLISLRNFVTYGSVTKEIDADSRRLLDHCKKTISWLLH